MNTSLRDQLLKAGLVSEKQARQASQQEQQRQFRDRPKPNVGQPRAEQNPAARAAQAAKAARDQELNRRQQQKAASKARTAQTEQLIEQERLPKLESDDFYSFIDGKKIRRVIVNAQRREQLIRGELAIVRYKGHHEVVPAAAAARIRERDEHAVVPHNVTEASSGQDDAYKDFVVPDDLMW